MNLLRKVEFTSYDLVGSTRLIKLGIIAQLEVHSPIIVKGINSNGGVATCIYCMVSTMDFFKKNSNLSYFCFFFQFSIFEHMFFNGLILRSCKMDINHVNQSSNNFYLGYRFVFHKFSTFVFEHNLHFFQTWDSWLICGPLSNKCGKYNLMVLGV